MKAFNNTSSLAHIHGLKRLLLIVLLAFLAGFGPLCTDMYLPTLPLVSTELNMSTSLTQASIGICLLGLALGQIIIGPISDGQGRKGLLLGSILLFTISSLLCAKTTDATSFILFRFLQGLGGAGGAVLCRAVSCDSFSGTKLTQFLSLFMAVTGIAPVVAPLLGSMITATSFGWKGIFLLLSVTGALLCIGSFFIIPETLQEEKRIKGGLKVSFTNMGHLIHERTFLWYVGVHGFTAVGFFCYISTSPFIFQNIHHFTIQEFSLLFGINAVILAISSILAGNINRRFSDRSILLVGNSIRAIASLALFASCFFDQNPYPLIISLMVMLFGQGLAHPPSFSLAIMAQNVGFGAASGVLGVIFFICGALASPLTGVETLGIVCAVSGLGALWCTLKA